MKTLLALALSVFATTSARADVPLGPQPPAPPVAKVEAAPAAAAATKIVYVEVPAPVETVKQANKDEQTKEKASGWAAPSGRRLLHGFRLGYNHISNFNAKTREGDMSIKDEFKLKTPHSMILGYEAFYRIIGHSWLNVLLVGNVSVAGLEQSKVIPTASGLIGAEFNESFQLGVGINVTPDPQSPTHMMAAIGWTPRTGGIYTPVHFYFIPDTEGNHRAGATVGVTW